jgi:hypothetical protein
MLIFRKSKLHFYGIWYRHTLWAAVQCTGWARTVSKRYTYVPVGTQRDVLLLSQTHTELSILLLLLLSSSSSSLLCLFRGRGGALPPTRQKSVLWRRTQTKLYRNHDDEVWLNHSPTRILITLYISRGGGCKLGCHISRMRGVGVMFMIRRVGTRTDAAHNKH